MTIDRIQFHKLLIFVTLFSFASTASAQVVINEIAWMGTAESATNEWIELLNNGSDTVNLSGWILRIEGRRNKDIALTNSISAGAYYLIERTDDNTLPNILADLITPFGAGLSNGGTTLVLFNEQGLEIDRVNGNDNWRIGGKTAGNNTTKETAQRAGALWITATATPRAVNATPRAPAHVPVQVKTVTAPISAKPSVVKPIAVAPPQANLQLSYGINSVEDKSISKTIPVQEFPTTKSDNKEESSLIAFLSPSASSVSPYRPRPMCSMTCRHDTDFTVAVSNGSLFKSAFKLPKFESFTSRGR